MQSYEEHQVSEFAADRHPYLEPPFSSEINPLQVTLAVFDRQIAKLSENLSYSGLPDDLRSDALHTLNELVEHQETKDEMISYGVLGSAAILLDSLSWPVRKEAGLLIGGLVTLLRARDLSIDSEIYPPLQIRLTDDVEDVRLAVAWSLTRLSQSRDGVEKLVVTNTIPVMVDAFKTYSRPKHFHGRNSSYLFYLIDAFVNICEFDNGIEPVLGTGLTKALLKFLKSSEERLPEDFIQLSQGTLQVLSHIALSHEGKAECTDLEAIKLVSSFLELRRSDEQLRHCCSFIMAVTISLAGKHQVVEFLENGEPVVIQNMFKLLQSNRPQSVKTNAIQSLHNLADLPLGFQQCVDILSTETSLLDLVFGAKAVKPLASLLPKLSSYPNPPEVPPHAKLQGVRLIPAICCLLEKYPDAVVEAIDSVNIAQKLAPYLNTDVAAQASSCLVRICKQDPHNLSILRSFVVSYPGTRVDSGLQEVLG
jgi:hypothetical protein